MNKRRQIKHTLFWLSLLFIVIFLFYQPIDLKSHIKNIMWTMIGITTFLMWLYKKTHHSRQSVPILTQILAQIVGLLWISFFSFVLWSLLFAIAGIMSLYHVKPHFAVVTVQSVETTRSGVSWTILLSDGQKIHAPLVGNTVHSLPKKGQQVRIVLQESVLAYRVEYQP